MGRGSSWVFQRFPPKKECCSKSKSSSRSDSPDNTPLWAKKLLEVHERSKECLQFLEKELKSQPFTERSHTKLPQPEFKYKRNKIQYELNEKVLDKLDMAASTSDEKAWNDALEEGRKSLKERNRHVSWKIQLGGCQLLCSGAFSLRLRWWEAYQAGSQREQNIEGRKQEASEALGTTNWPFSAVIHVEPEFSQREADSYSCVEAKIGFKPKQRVFLLRKTWAFHKKMLHTYPLIHNRKNILRYLLNHISLVMLILIGTMIWMHRPSMNQVWWNCTID